MYKVDVHPILDIPKGSEAEFRFDGRVIKGEAGLTIATPYTAPDTQFTATA